MGIFQLLVLAQADVKLLCFARQDEVTEYVIDSVTARPSNLCDFLKYCDRIIGSRQQTVYWKLYDHSLETITTIKITVTVLSVLKWFCVYEELSRLRLKLEAWQL